jgi:sphingomyelin phosphodiesterase acid-like 3
MRARMRSRRLAALCGAFVAIFSTTCGWVEAAEATQTWLVVSDIHLDPFNRSSYPSLPGRDTNLALFSSALAEMRRDVPNPSMVLLPGDFLVHNFPAVARRDESGASVNGAGLNAMRFIEAAFARAYPHARFAIALGNNDAPCGDYHSDIGDDYLASLTRLWAPLIDRQGAAPTFASTFSHGGYYTVALPIAGFRLVVLNTILFSSEFKGACTGRATGGAREELEWTKATLQATPAGLRNVVMMHIPPGYDAVSTQATKGFVPWAFLNANDNAALIAALTDERDRVAYAFAGHTHRFDFRLIGDVPMLLFGSISPIYSNNPAFYAVRVRSDGLLRDIDVYTYDEWSGVWTPRRSFDRTWSVERIDAPALNRIHERLAVEPAMRQRWDLASNGWPSNPDGAWATWGRWWRISWCAQTVLQSGFARCAGIERRVAVGRLLAGVIVAGGIALAALLTWFGVRALRGLIAR